MVPEHEHHITVDELPGLTHAAPVVIKATPRGPAIGMLPDVVPLHVRQALEVALTEAYRSGMLNAPHLNTTPA